MVDNAWLRPVFVVPMAATCAVKIPAVLFNKLDRFADFHVAMLTIGETSSS